MKNKGFFWFLTTVLALVCIYQVSFTFIANSEEKEAESVAQEQVDSIIDVSKENEVVQLPSGDFFNVSSERGQDSARNYYVNEYLKSVGKEDIHPFLDQTYDEVKSQSINLGLDLKGGMSVTLELSVSHLIKNIVTDNRDPKFKQVFKNANDRYNAEGGDFIDVFGEEYEKLHPEGNMADLFYEVNENIEREMENDAVIAQLKLKATDALGNVEKVINKRVNQFGVSQPNITKDPLSNRVMVELPGVKDRETVRKRLKSTANLMFFEVYDPGAFLQVVNKDIEKIDQEFVAFIGEEAQIDSTISTDTLSIASNGITKYIAFNGTDEQGRWYMPGVIGWVLRKDTAVVGSFLRSPAMTSRIAAVGDLENSLVPMFSTDVGEDGRIALHAIKVPTDGKAPVEGDRVKKASQGFQQNKPVVNIEFTSEGSGEWYTLTKNNVGRPIAIVMDNVVYSAPNVKEAMNQGSCYIEGQFTIEDVKGLADLLNGGSLPAPCKIVEESTVGPTLAADNISAGLMSFGIALLIVLLYMIAYYGKAGIMSDVALLFNMLFIVGALASFKAVLTLAGIAGIVLTIGMSVDANVLIFERIREEMANGKGLKAAVGDGYKKALAAILDANITTLLTAIVLKVFGSGPIESFATTLIIGIFTSVFAAIVITRLMLEISIKKNSDITFSTGLSKNLFKNMNKQFVSNRKKYYIISGILIIAGIGSLAVRGLDFGLEFTGGHAYTVTFDKEVDNDMVKEAFAKNLVYGEEQGTVEVKQKGDDFTAEIKTNFLIENENADSLLNVMTLNSLNDLKGDDKLGESEIVQSQSFLPVISEELKSSSLIAILISLVIIFIYILIRFGKWQYGLGALLAMAHDVILVLAIFSIGYAWMPFSMEIDQAFIAAILTVVGYSINDTVVVFDRIREYIGLNKTKDRKVVINEALNSTLSRTINTSLSTFVVLLMIFIFGGPAIKGFVFALMIGVIVGTYSSICIATPTVVDLTKSKKIKEGDKA